MSVQWGCIQDGVQELKTGNLSGICERLTPTSVLIKANLFTRSLCPFSLVFLKGYLQSRNPFKFLQKFHSMELATLNVRRLVDASWVLCDMEKTNSPLDDRCV